MKKFLRNNFLRWFNKKEVIFLAIILCLAGFLRLYMIADYMTFLGDEGRDVIIVKHLLEGHLVGLGPTASVGGFFTGPIYYYFMAPFLWLFHLDPVGPAVMVGLFGVATVLLIYIVGRDFLGAKAGIFAAALYSVSPLVIGYSHSSWNPNLMPFFSLLAIFTTYKAVRNNSWKLFIFTGILLGIAIQLHYIELFFIIGIIAFLFVVQFKKFTLLLFHYAYILLGFLIGLSPFLAFEVIHGFPNSTTVVKFIFGSTGETGFSGERFFTIITDVALRLFGRLIILLPPTDQLEQIYNKDYLRLAIWKVGSLALLFSSLATLGINLFKSRNTFDRQKYLLLASWFFFGVIFFGLYKKSIYDYYFEFMFPLPFLLFGQTLAILYTAKKLKTFGKILATILFVFLMGFNLEANPFKHPPNRQLAQAKTISEFVLAKADSKAFNFALLTTNNSDHEYRYFFEIEGNPSVEIQPVEKDLLRKSVTDQLLVLCEDPNCKPLGNPLWEVAGFGRAEIVGQWQVTFMKVFKLIHYQET